MRTETARKRKNKNPVQPYIIAAILVIVAVVAAVIVTVSDGEASGGALGSIVGNWEHLLGDEQDARAEDAQVPDWVTQDLLTVNDYSRPGTALERVNGVVVHYVGNPGTTAAQNRSYFQNLAQTHETYASSHFIVDTDGTVIQCVPLDEVAYCSNERNADTISIECCHLDESGEFTDAELSSLKKLLTWLIDTYDLEREDILRHYDITGKICPKYYVDNPDAWAALLDELFA